MGVKYLTTNELAERWGTSPFSLANMRYTKRGPAFEHVGRTVIYYVKTIQAYELAHPQWLQKSRRALVS